MTQHTPGPWWTNFDAKGYSGLLGVFGKREVNGAREDCIIVQPGAFYEEDNWPTVEEQEANAVLIAKAWLIPELIAACEGIVQAYDQYVLHVVPDGAVASACKHFGSKIADCIEVINKARATP